MSLHAHIVAHERGVDARLDAAAGSTLALLGPNGSGKSTILAAIAGTLRPDAGEVRLHGRLLHALSISGSTWQTPRQRRVALVTQRDDLFPGMTVVDNVAYGIRARGASRADARAEARTWLARVGLEQAASDRPRALSGGQARRATIARALAANPEALLLDEPFAGVDVESVASLRTLVREVTADVTTVLTTHDVLDAHVLADDVAVLGHGSVAETGTAGEVLARPRTPFAAAMAGRTLLSGIACARGLRLDDGTTVPADVSAVSEGSAALVSLAPQDLRIAAADEDHDVTDTVHTLESHRDLIRVCGARLSLDTTPASIGTLAPGATMRLRIVDVPVAYLP